MQFEANIKARNEDGILERILRTCRHRGFGMHAVHAFVDPEGETVQIQIKGESERSPVLLARQIEKFYDVLEVSVEIPKQEFPALASANELQVPINFMRRASYARTSN